MFVFLQIDQCHRWFKNSSPKFRYDGQWWFWFWKDQQNCGNSTNSILLQMCVILRKEEKQNTLNAPFYPFHFTNLVLICAHSFWNSWPKSKNLSCNDGFRWLATIGQTIEWLHTIVEVYLEQWGKRSASASWSLFVDNFHVVVSILFLPGNVYSHYPIECG